MRPRLAGNDQASVALFSDRMMEKLEVHRSKGHWGKMDSSSLLELLEDELEELRDAIENEDDPLTIILECADVANFAMMIADNQERLLRQEDQV